MGTTRQIEIPTSLKIWLYSIVVYGIVLLLCVVCYQTYRAWYIRTQERQLEQFRDMREQEVYDFFKKLEQSVRALVRDDEVRTQMYALLEIAENYDSSSFFHSQEYERVYTPIMELMQKKRAQYPLRNTMIVSPKGRLIFSEDVDEDLGLVLIKGMYKDTELAKVIMQVLKTNTAAISDFSHYPAVNSPTSFIAVPIMEGNTLVGIFAAEMDQTQFYQLTHDTELIGKTGEVVLGKKLGDKVVLITPSIEDPTVALMRRMPFGDPNAYPIQSGSRGETKTRFTVDYSGKEVVAAWKPLDLFNWVIVVKKEVREINKTLQPIKDKFEYIFLVLLIILLCIGMIGMFKWGVYCFSYAKPIMIWRITCASIGIILVGLLCVLGFFVHRALSTELYILSRVKTEAKIRGQYATQLLTHYFLLLQKSTQHAAQEIRFPMREEQIKTIGIGLLKEHTTSAGVQLIQQSNQHSFIEMSVTSTHGNFTYEKKEFHVDQRTDNAWNTIFTSGKAQWSDPYFDDVAQVLVVAYMVPLFDDDQSSPVGVLSLLYPLEALKERVLLLGTSGTGYVFITTHDGKLLYHPHRVFVQEQKTIQELAQKSDLLQLLHVGEQIKKGVRGVEFIKGSLFEGSSWASGFTWVYYQPIPIVNWSLVHIFFDEGLVPQGFYLRKILVVIAVLLVLIGLCILLLYGLLCFSLYNRAVWVCGTLYTIIAFLGVMSILMIHRRSPLLHYRQIIFDNVELQRFLEHHERAVEKRYEKHPVPIPTGIFIHLLDLSTFGSVQLTGYVWQHFDRKNEPMIQKGVAFPQSYELSQNEAYKMQDDEHTTIGWNVQAQLIQEHSYVQYPFDEKHVQVVMDSVDEQHNVILIPDLASYNLVHPSGLPGIERHALATGFVLKKSFFGFDTIIPDTYFGVPEHTKNTQRVRLTYNVLLQRSLLHVFFVFFLPLLVIIFWLFAILRGIERVQKPKYSIITAYTSLFFSAIIGQQLFRRQFTLSEITYMEYLFLFVYVSIFLLVIHSILLVLSEKIREKKLCLSQWFFPSISTFWLLVTVFTFYRA